MHQANKQTQRRAMKREDKKRGQVFFSFDGRGWGEKESACLVKNAFGRYLSCFDPLD